MSVLKITKTMLDKSICDCNGDVREYLKKKGFVNYEELQNGERKKHKAQLSLYGQKSVECTVSFYKTSRGDRRIWVTNVRKTAQQGNELRFKIRSNKLYVKLTGENT